jgi:hypothetical protein
MEIDGKEACPLRFVKVAEAREHIKKAETLIRYLSKYARPLDKMRKREVDNWLGKVTTVLDGLPQTFGLNDLVRYDVDGTMVDGVVIATVTCHEQYVVGPGDSRDSHGEPMFMIHAHKLTKRA